MIGSENLDIKVYKTYIVKIPLREVTVEEIVDALMGIGGARPYPIIVEEVKEPSLIMFYTKG